MVNFSKLIIGGAQIGMKYGVSNKKGKIQEKSLTQILKYCLKKKINLIDTATSYKDSIYKIEKTLNKNKLKNNFKLIIKVSDNDLGNIDYFLSKYSKNNYNYCIMAHKSEFFFKKNFKKFIDINKKNKRFKIGVSIYENKELKALKKYFDKIDIIQLPYNILNFKQFDHKLLNLAKKSNIKIHARSIFHQGFFFLTNYEIKKKFPIYLKRYLEFKNKIEHKNLTVAKLALNFTYNSKIIDNVIIGIDSLEHIKKNIKQIKKMKISNKKIKILEYYQERQLIPDPRSF